MNDIDTHGSKYTALAGYSEPRGTTSAASAGYDPSSASEAPRSAGPALESHPPGFKSDGAQSAWKEGERRDRSSSFNNLAAALGSGLAESMEDATNGEQATKAMLTDSFLSANTKDDNISYARHSRHAASRFIGAGQPRDVLGNHKGLEPGSLFGTLDTTDRKKLNAAAQEIFPDYSKDFNTARNVGLTQTFSADSLRNPVSSFNNPYSHPKSYANARLTTSKDLGTTVVEPDAFDSGSNRQRNGSSMREVQRDMQRLWSDRNQSSSMSAGSRDSQKSHSEVQFEADEELRPFCWDTRHHEASRALAITRAGSLSSSDVRSICESYGAIENFRSDFADRGVFFVSYYDLRCSQYAAMDLQMRLYRLGPMAERVLVQFCVPLNSSSQHDESLVVLMDVPQDIGVENLAGMLSSYGAVRSLKSMGGSYGGQSFVVEYHDVQDAKQAVLELESTHQFGPNVSVEVGARNPADRKRGRELLALIGRWRHGASGKNQQHSAPPPAAGRYATQAMQPHRYDGQGAQHQAREPTTQLVLGPDGRYTYAVVNDTHNHHSPRYSGGPPPQYQNDRGYHGHTSNQYVTHVNASNQHQYWQPQTHHFSSSGSVVSHSSYGSSGHYPSATQSLPYYRDTGSVGSHSHRMSAGPSSASSAGVDNTHLVLDLDAVENGRDTRTSLMVRNIPNKYTQQMLLNEFMENGHGPGVIDFFYLPIDFKNRCNRGYAFINFVDTRDIMAFHRQYFGKHWRTFNSDKICDITYARIQGKAAMLKRFENSALMEKDDEYKPLVFVSNGPEKGKKLPFPTPSV